MDFSLILVVLTAVSGLIWGGEILLRRIAQAEGATPSDNIAVEYARSFFPVLLLVLVIRSFLFEPFRIPSGSMLPTLLIGDFIFVNKFAYGLRLPVVHTKVLELGAPERGDVVVFRLPTDPSVTYIKRLVGLPGDEVVYRDYRLTINGEECGLERPFQGERRPIGEPELAAEQLGGVEHNILLQPQRPSREGRFVVPDGHYFMMGDNRDNSQDSRYPAVGYVPERNIVGKAVRVWMSWDFPAAPRWARIGAAVR
ncbi:MAG: signal peptidase I [Gammaproteobacteria bacterium]|jgi:signal peptidase I|nr:signal peptidase I [Gammaproteobacteria bacterium]